MTERRVVVTGIGTINPIGNNARHAAEFWMIEPEMAFAELEDIMELGEGLTRHVADR